MATEPHPNVSVSGSLRSEFAEDPDMKDILEMFVQELPSRAEDLRRCLRENETAKLARVAHQLKGAGGGYGFPLISEVAGRLEATIASLNGSPAAATLEEVRRQVDALIDLCHRATPT